MEFLLKFAIFTSFCVLSQCQFPFVFPTFQQFPNQPAYQSPPMSPQPANEQNRNSPNVQRSWQPSYQPVFQPISRQINPHSQQWSQPCQQGSNFGYPHNNYYNPNPCPTQFDNSQQVWNTRTRSTTTIRTTLRPVAAASTGRISSAKCEEYKKLSVETIKFGGLLLNSESYQERSIPKCDITTGLIVGGVKAKPKEFPHMAAIGYSDFENGITFKCGGSLISQRHVLTCAHCAYSGRSSASIVRLGAIELESSSAKDFPIESFIPHEGYDAREKQNDIAVIKLTMDVSFSDPTTIRPACLWQREEIGQDKTIASGWGYTSYGGTTSADLLKVQLDILGNEVCDSAYEDEDVKIGKKQICAGVLAGNKDTCQGDSGGPIQIVLHDNMCASHIIGITSYGGYCGGKNSPSVYTRVSSYLDWIESKVWN